MENRIEESILREYIFPSLNKKLAEIICHTKLFRNSAKRTYLFEIKRVKIMTSFGVMSWQPSQLP